MPRIELSTLIAAPIGRVFDLSRSIEIHQESQVGRSENAVAGKTSGLIEKGESVTWEAVHFGIRQRLSSRIVSMTIPSHFRDSMIAGAFKRFDHDHFFEENPDGTTLMKDVFDYASPMGWLGRIADALFLERYMTKLLAGRNEVIKRKAEFEGLREGAKD